MLAVENKPAGYTMRQAAILMGVHEKRIYQLVKEHRINSYTGVDGKMMVTKEEIYHYIRNNR